MSESVKVTIGTLAGGAVEERFTEELQNVLRNIMDPNTEWKPRSESTGIVVCIQNARRTNHGVV